MNGIRIQTLISFVVLLLLQEFIFSNIDLGIYINIFVYVMFILLLPANYSPLMVLLLSGLMGFAVDIFSSGVLGLNMAASLAMGFVRPYVLKMVTTSSDFPQDVPIIRHAEIRKVIIYTITLVFLHHFVLFMLEAYSLSQILFVLLRTIASTVATTIFIIVFELLVGRK